MSPSLWQRVVGCGFRLLYHELACLYDPVSWAVSLGRWRRWQQTALAYLPPEGRVLEVGFGPGHLLADLAAAGYAVAGVDLSRHMVRRARRRLRRLGRPAPLALGRAHALPFAPGAFSAIVATFPTPYIYDPAWIDQARRVLAPGGRLVVVQGATFLQSTPLTRSIDGLYRITGQRGPGPDLVERLVAGGLAAWREAVEVQGTRVHLVVAEKEL